VKEIPIVVAEVDPFEATAARAGLLPKSSRKRPAHSNRRHGGRNMKVNVGDELIQGMENAVAHLKGRKPARRKTVVAVAIPERIDVRAIRQKLGLTQQEFAARFGFTVKSIRNWEQDGRQPEGAARAYLLVIDRVPKVVEKALRAA
jgi:putative transcriptional regulator